MINKELINLVERSVDSAFKSFDVQKNSEKKSEVKKKLKERIESLLREQDEENENVKASIEIEARDKETIETIFDFVEFAENLCKIGASRSMTVKDPVDNEERDKKWSFDGDGHEKITNLSINYEEE